MHGQALDAPLGWLNKRLATTLCAQIRRCKQGKLFLTTSLVTRHFPRQAGKMRFAAGEQPLITIDWKLDA